MVRTKLILFLISINVFSGFAQSGGNIDSKATAFLKKFRSDYTKSVLGDKPEMLQAYYADSIRLMPEFQKTIIGKSNALLYHRSFSGRFEIIGYSREPIETLGLGSRIAELGLFNMTLKLRSTGKQYILKGKYHDFWQKSDNGDLALITEAWNYNHQVDIAEQLRFSDVPVVDVAMKAHVPINNNIRFELAALNRLQEMVIMQHDSKLWAQFFTDDARYIYSSSPIYSGKKELSDFFDEHVKHIPVFEKLDIRNDKIDDLGEYVIEYASHIAIVRSGDFSGVFTGKNITVWRREKDCSLKIFREMAMYD